MDLSDAELMEVLKNHGMGRRTLMKALGVGTGVAALGGTATADSGGLGQAASQDGHIDKMYGASYKADEDVPDADHTVELHTHGAGTDGEHEGFPVPDDAVDSDRATPGFQPDSDDADDYPEFHFEPVGLHVEPGDVVQFTAETPLHTVTAYHPYFNEGEFLRFPKRVPAGPFTSALMTAGDSWLYQFDKKGVYDIQCLPHQSLGMVMRVLVFDPGEDDIEDDTFETPTGPIPPNAGAVLNAEKLSPSNIEDEGAIGWGDLDLSRRPYSLPRPAVDELTLTRQPGSESTALLAKWKVSDPNGALNTVHLTLRGAGGTVTKDVACDVISGKSSGRTTRLVPEGGAAEEYQIELTVTNSQGLSVTDVASTGGE